MNKYKKLGQNIILLTLGNVGSKLITFFLVPLYTSALTTEQYGTTDLIFTLYNLLIPVVTVEVYFALMRFSLEKDADHSQLFTGSVCISAIGILILILCRPIFVSYAVIAPYFWLFIGFCFTNCFNTVLLYFARGIDHVHDYAVATIINTASVVALNIIFLLRLHLGITGYLLAYTCSHFLACMYLFVRLKVWRYWISPLHLDRELLGKMVVYCIPLIPNTISWWVSNQSDKLIIILFDGIALSGIYAIAYKIPSVLSVISNIFINAWQISSVEDFGSESSRRFYENIYNKYHSVQILMTSCVMLLCRIAARILFKKDFFEAWHYVPVLTVAVMFHAMGSFFASVYTAAKKTKGIGISTVAGALINIGLNFLLIPRYHAYGAAIATLISYIVIVVVRIWHSRTFFSFPIPFAKDLLCWAILGVQVVVSSIDIQYRYLFSAACFLLLLVLRRAIIGDAVLLMRKMPVIIRKRLNKH